MVLLLISVKYSFPMSRLVLRFTNFISMWRREFRIAVKNGTYFTTAVNTSTVLFLPSYFFSSFWKFWILQGSSEKEGKMMTSKSTGGGPGMWKPSRFIWANWPTLCLPRTDSLFSLCFPWAHLDSSEWAFRDPLCDLIAKTRRIWPAGHRGGPTPCLKGSVPYKSL